MYCPIKFDRFRAEFEKRGDKHIARKGHGQNIFFVQMVGSLIRVRVVVGGGGGGWRS